MFLLLLNIINTSRVSKHFQSTDSAVHKKQKGWNTKSKQEGISRSICILNYLGIKEQGTKVTLLDFFQLQFTATAPQCLISLSQQVILQFRPMAYSSFQKKLRQICSFPNWQQPRYPTFNKFNRKFLLISTKMLAYFVQ